MYQSLLQRKILHEYKTVFPNQTIKEVAITTKIHPSRVFRLLNGYEMKISEYEKIDKILREKDAQNNYKEFFNLTNLCFKSLNDKKINTLIDEMNFQLKCKTTKTEVAL